MKFSKLTFPFIVSMVVVSSVLNYALTQNTSLPQWEVDPLSSFIAVLVSLPLLKLNKNK